MPTICFKPSPFRPKNNVFTLVSNSLVSPILLFKINLAGSVFLLALFRGMFS
jgi:hypothetical protein